VRSTVRKDVEFRLVMVMISMTPGLLGGIQGSFMRGFLLCLQMEGVDFGTVDVYIYLVIAVTMAVL